MCVCVGSCAVTCVCAFQSIIRVVFHDRRLQYTEHQQLEGWRWNRPGDRILDLGERRRRLVCCGLSGHVQSPASVHRPGAHGSSSLTRLFSVDLLQISRCRWASSTPGRTQPSSTRWSSSGSRRKEPQCLSRYADVLCLQSLSLLTGGFLLGEMESVTDSSPHTHV